jgi:predicted PurR-regulated permease PerM
MRRRRRTQTSHLVVLESAVLIATVLYFAKPVLVPLTLAVLLTFVLAPVVAVVERRGAARVPAVLVVALLTFTLVGALGWTVGRQVHKLASDLPSYTERIQQKLAALQPSGDGLFSRLSRMAERISEGTTPASEPEGRADPDPSIAIQTNDASPHEPPAVVALAPARVSRLEQLTAIAGPVIEPLATLGLIVVLVIFMLMKREDVRDRMIGLLGHGRLTGATRVLIDAAERLSRFLLTQLLVNAAFGVVVAIGLTFIGVPYAFLWAVLTMLLRFVPYVGALVSAAFPLLLSFAISPGWTQPLLVLALFVVLDLVTANVIEPLVIGHSTGVSPLALLVAAAFWTWIWGPVGLALATPLTVCLVVLGQHVGRLGFLSVLLSDRPPLAPHVSYYQRLLADDLGEASRLVAAHADAEGTARVPDDVILPALAMARRDRQRGELSAERARAIHEATRTIVTGRSVVDEPPPTAMLALGLPAHHEAEEILLLMLAQLLAPAGCRLDVVSSKALPREIESRIEQDKPAAVLLAILPPGGVEQAIYQCKRLRKRFPELTIVVGYFGTARRFDKLLVRFRSAGANYLTTSLEQSRNQLLEQLVAAEPRPEGATGA